MKAFVALSGFVATVMAQAIQFNGTSFGGPFTVGQTVPVGWTIGNSQSVILTLSNATWSYNIFEGQASPSMYDWMVSAPAGFVAGNYRLSIQQANNGAANSPLFTINNPAMAPNTTATMSSTSTAASLITATVTFVYFDPACGCTKTGTAAAGLNTSIPVSTYWDEQCGCHQTVVPAPSSMMPIPNNATIPMTPKPIMAQPSTTATMTSMPSLTSAVQPFKGGVGKLQCSVSGIAALFIAIAIL